MNKTYEVITERMVDFIEKNKKLPWRKPWVGETAPCNYLTKKPYRGINAILTAISPYSSPYFLTFKQVNDLKGKVKKGEKSTPIIFWNLIDKKSKEEDEEDETKKIGFYKMYYVFNAEQIEGIEFKYPKLIEKEFSPIQLAEDTWEKMQEKPEIFFNGKSAFYNKFSDSVTVPPRETFLNPESFYATLFHELSHSTGHEKRLGRFKDQRYASFGSEEYSREELVAEISSSFILNSLGINSNFTDENSLAYIQSWLQVLKNNPTWIITSANKAEKSANYILGKEEE